MASNQAARCFALLLSLTLLLVTSVSSSPSDKRKSLNTVMEMNRKGPYIGLITVFPPEEDAFFSTGAFEINPHHPFVDLSGRRFRVGKVHGRKVIYVRCGVGVVNAAAATQQMVDVFDIVGIVHFGISGNANNSMSKTICSYWHLGLNPNGTLPSNDIAQLEIGSYNFPKKGENLLGRIGYRYEQFFSEKGKPNTPQPLFWANTNRHWLRLAAKLETTLSNGFPVIVIRGLSNLAGEQAGQNSYKIYGPLVALNAAKVVIQFIKTLSESSVDLN